MAALFRMQFVPVLLLIAFVSPSCCAPTRGNCSTTCESQFCRESPYLRYGKYCGIFYSGCPGEEPCDGLDRCCMVHDDCVGDYNYLNVTCNEALLQCVQDYRNSGEGQFPGNTCNVADVENSITVAVQAGIWAGEGIGDGPASPNQADQLSSIPAGDKQQQIHANPHHS